ncbi:hypothetical protein ABK040_001777 [Willaertia magna]
MSGKIKLFSCGLNQSENLGHSLDDGYFHEMTIIPDYLQIKEIKCGRSHTLFKTINNELYAFGRNDYGQCGVDSSNESIPQITKCKVIMVDHQLATNDNNNIENNNIENNFVNNVHDFSTGWFHSLLILNDCKNIYYSGGCFSNHSISPTRKFTILKEVKLKQKQNKFTKILSGSHSYSVVIDDRYICYHGDKEFDIFKITNSYIKEICASSYGFVFITLDNKLLHFGNALRNASDSIVPFNLDKYNNEDLQFYEIRTCNTYSGITFKTNIGITKSEQIGNIDQFTFNSKSDELFPEFKYGYL